MAGELQGRIAVVTAAASGMGRDTALRFADEGAHVVAIDIDAGGGAALLDEIRAAGGKAEFLTADLSDLGRIEEVVGSIAAEHKRIDVLFNHVGVAVPHGFDFDAEAWDFQVALNLRAPVFLTKLAMPLMSAGGSIVFTSSVSGLIASRNSPVYSALKTGIVGFTRAIAAVGGPQGIRANVVCPGIIDTPMAPTFFATEDEPREAMQARLDAYLEAVPMRRMGQPREVAEVVLFLASDRSSFVTGTFIPVDGGYVAV
jgi:NAD(P)-dependent dehydrogenase (short-subunit alcohol dehydrogenase family)